MTQERAVPFDDEQNDRCRNLEFAVLLRALLDAAWRESDIAHYKETPQNLSRKRACQTHRAAARGWLLSPANHEHVETIAERAGLPEGAIWSLVERFVRGAEDPAPLRQIYDSLMHRPGSFRLGPDVAFVA